MEYKTRAYPPFSACGLNCGLCPRYHTNGGSQCPGCASPGFSEKHPSCGVLSCCQRKGFAHCFLCDDYPCRKYEGANLFDSFITHQNQFRDFEKAKKFGLEIYEAELNSKIEALEFLLQFCDDGRKKSFFCTAVNLLDFPDVSAVVGQIKNEISPDTLLKNRAAIAVRFFEELSVKRGISLHLRKKSS